MYRTPTTFRRLAASAALATTLGLTALAVPNVASATTPVPSLPQATAAHAAADWLASQVTPGGYVASTVTPGAADLDGTANTVLALASAGVDTATAHSALAYLQGHVSSYVTVAGSDGPGQLALLILDADALGASPTSFGGTNLVARLQSTQRTTGVDAGLFGTQDPTYDGAYRQGLSLAALASAGVTSGTTVTAAESWLTGQQCRNGGWTSYITSFDPCNGKPAKFEGPDANSSALAVEGLEAQHALSTAAAAAASRYFLRAQDADGGWSYEPNAAKAPESSDPDSTAVVLQALLSLGVSPSSAKFAKAADPVALLDSFQITSGSATGAIAFPGIAGPNLLATEQATPALAGVTFAYDLGSPVVTKISPTKGVSAGGRTVHVSGSGFTEATAVHFGASAATGVTVDSSTSLTAVSPAGAAGTVDVTVTTPSGTSPVAAPDRFTYKA